VEFADGVQLIQLDDRWTLARRVQWAVDGSGLLATTDEGLHYIPGPSYMGSYELSRGIIVEFHSPDQWSPRATSMD
jgi:hypothetical protein